MSDNNNNNERTPRRRFEQAEGRLAPPPETRVEDSEERIAKTIARAGIASRRDAEAMIAEGRVTLNGAVLTSPAVNVTQGDAITVDGEPLPARERTRLWIYHKPRGLVTTARDPEGRPTVFENLPEDLPRVVTIGRLDINTEGLLLLTNDGGLARVIAHPETGWLRRYKVRAHGDITQAELDRLRDGITVDDMAYGPIEATLDRVQGDNIWITLGLREGKNREIKRVLEHLGLNVNRLIRLSFGPFQLGDLEPGLVEEVRTKVLKEQLGLKLAAAAGVDFESPVREPIAPFGSPKREERARSVEGSRPPRGRPTRDDRRDFAPKGRDERAPRGRREDAPPRRPARNEPRRSVWRAEEAERPRHKAPRRGEDPKAARQAAAGRPRERVRAIEAGERKVLVERLVSEPNPEARRPPRSRGERRPTPGGEDRPRRAARGAPPGEARNREFGDRPPRGARGDGFDGRRSAADGERPARRFGEDRTKRGTFGGDRPGRTGPPGERPARGPRRDRPPGPRDRDDRPRSGFRSEDPREGRTDGGLRSDGPRKGPGRSRSDGPRKEGFKGPRGAGPKGPPRRRP